MTRTKIALLVLGCLATQVQASEAKILDSVENAAGISAAAFDMGTAKALSSQPMDGGEAVFRPSVPLSGLKTSHNNGLVFPSSKKIIGMRSGRPPVRREWCALQPEEEALSSAA